MIRVSALTPSDIGRWVEYTDTQGYTERGRLKSWNSGTIHVVYHCSNEWHRFRDFTGQATNPADLEFVSTPIRDSKCGACARHLPGRFLSSFVSTEGNIMDCCGVCALQISNRIHGEHRGQFDGEGAEANRLAAIQHYEKTGQPV